MNGRQPTTEHSGDGQGPLIPLEEAARLEEVTYAAEKQSLRRRHIILGRSADDRRQKLVPVSALSAAGKARWLKHRSNSPVSPFEAPNPAALAIRVESSPQPLLPFQPPTETERALASAVPWAVPKHQHPYVDRWAKILAETTNGDWRRRRGETQGGVLIKGARSFVQGLGNVYDVGATTIYAKLKILREIERDPSVPDDQKKAEFWKRILPRPRPGLSGHSFFAKPDNSWAYFKLRTFYLNQAKLSVKRAYELLCLEIRAKQRAWGVKHPYEKPTLKQCRTALEKLDLATVTLGREGEKVYNDRCAPYISRRPPAHANDIWVTDQRLCNVRLRDGGNQLGRIWVVNFLDVASWRWLGCMFAPVLNSDVVMAAAAMSLERAGVPRAVHMDLGKEFTGKRFLGGIFTIRGEVLFRDAVGLWERLNVQVIRAIGRNPQSKTIERWHRELDRFDQEMPGWCGSNPDERPEKLAREEAAHRDWLGKGTGRSPLLGIPEYINRYLDFCERRWNSEHRGRGKYLQGMTPNEVWNTRLPESGLQKLTRERVDFYTADHRQEKVTRGGQVNLTFHGLTVEYEAPELLSRQRQEVEVVISRRSLGQVTVFYSVPGGKASCIALRKPLHDWLPENRDEVRQALRCRAALKRAVKRGIQASEALAGATSLRELPALAAEIAPEVVGSFAAPGPRPEQEISGPTSAMGKFQHRRLQETSEEVAEKALRAMEEAS